MKVIFLLLNLAVQGLGSLCFGKIIQGIFQLIIWVVGFVLTLTGIGAIVGFPLIVIAWIWALVVSVGALSGGNRNNKYGN